MTLLQQVLDVLERGEVLCEVTAANMLRAAIEQRLVEAIAGDNLQSAPPACAPVDSRDIMAASLVLPEDLSRQTGRVLAGPEPNDGLELIKWWARAKARLRYIEVDAMLEERDK